MKADLSAIRLLSNVRGIPIHDIFGRDVGEPNPDHDHRPGLLVADLIFGRDINSGHEFLVYGRPILEANLRSGRSGRFRVVVVELDMATEELEMLVALVRVLRGRDDYMPWNEAPPELRLTPEKIKSL